MESEEMAFRRALAGVRIFFIFLFALLLLNSSSVQSRDPNEALRKYTRSVEFDFTEWTLDALFTKAVQASLKAEKFLSDEQQANATYAYLEQVGTVQQKNEELNTAVSAPDLQNRQQVIDLANSELEIEKARLNNLAPIAESVLQSQTERTLVRMGFGLGGQVWPPVLYRITDLPLDITISPRNEIRTLSDFSLQSGLDTLQKESIENGILHDFNLSALVESVGGIGAYPTMVMQTTDLNWLSETVAHEWIHNYLTFKPLGIRYYVNSEMRTINETTASISGKEISLEILRHYYPERVPWPNAINLRPMQTVTRQIQEQPKVFIFRTEMRVTRVHVDDLLSRGEIQQAEDYMEARRKIFWENGYQIRKINQAYFAFYGSYNDVPGGGASGTDPVGPAVQLLRKQFSGLHSFILKIEGVKSFAELEQLLK